MTTTSFSPGKAFDLSPNGGSVSGAMPVAAETVRIYNAGPSDIRFVMGATGGNPSNLAAVATDTMLPALVAEYFGKGGADTIAVYSAGSATVNITPGGSGD